MIALVYENKRRTMRGFSSQIITDPRSWAEPFGPVPDAHQGVNQKDPDILPFARIFEMVTKTFTVVLSVLVAGYAMHISLRKRRRLPPGPPSFPLIGQLLSAPLSFEHLGYKRLSEQLKSDIICLDFLGNTIVVLHSSQSASELLEKASAIYSDRTCPTMVEDETLLNWSNGLLFSSGEQIRLYRRILNTWLNKNASVAFHDRQVFQSRQLLARLRDMDGQTSPSERLMAEYYRFTAASIVGATYGYEIASLEDPFVVGIQEVVDNLSASILPTRFLVNAMPFLVHVPDWFPGTGWKQTAKEWRQQKDKILEDTYQWTRDQMAQNTAKPSILRSILEQYDGNREEISDEERDRYKQLCIAIFGAGSDTTAGTLMAFTIAMLLFPGVQRKAQEEIDQVIGFDRLPEMSDLPKLSYLSNLLQELLRWQPVLPLGIPHTCSQDNVYRGYTIPKGTIVIGNVWAMGRDPGIYKNPDVFDPDRFLDPAVPPVPAFGWGRRKCPGKHYAESALLISLASILATFNITKAKDTDGQDIIPSTAGQPSALIYLDPGITPSTRVNMATIPPPPGACAPPPLPPGWTEHKSPTGHTYYYHAATKQSTYNRPLPAIHMGGPPPGPAPPFPPTSLSTLGPPASAPSEPTTEKKSKKSKKEKPAKKTPIPDTPWIRVVTNLGNVFYTHSERKESVWTCPEEIAEAVAELEREEAAEREREELEKAEREREEKERAEVERVKKEAEAAGAKRKAEEASESAAKKPRVDDDDDDDDDEWQRQVAEEMANEERKNAGDGVAKGSEIVVPPVFKVPDQVKLNPEEAKALFMTLLNDVSPNPLMPYDLALPQLVNDARYVLLPPHERKAVFDDWCKGRARDMRKTKTKEATTSPEEAYESLLHIEVKSTRTHWDDFRRKWKKDRRFYGYGRDDKEREKKFRAWLVDLGEVKRKETKKAEDGFIELLKTIDGISKDSDWKDVKRGITQDPRYDAVGSSTRREELFNKFKETVQQKTEAEPEPSETEGKDGKEKESKATRRERALKEREAQVRATQSNVERDIGRSRGKLGREEAEREFGTVLTDAIRDPLTSWDAALKALESDPRFQHASQVLPPGAQRAMFATHIDHLRARYITQLHALFEAHTTGLDMPPEELPKSVRGSLPATKLGFVSEDADRDGPEEGEDEDEPKRRGRLNRGLEDEYARWQRSRAAEARLAFDALLGENSFVEFWGRLAKMGGEGVGGGVPVEEDEEENDEGEGGGGKVDMKALAKNVDVSEMEKVLKHDKRYTIFNHIPEQREQWIRDYLSHQKAPKLSVHAPEAK